MDSRPKLIITMYTDSTRSSRVLRCATTFPVLKGVQCRRIFELVQDTLSEKRSRLYRHHYPHEQAALYTGMIITAEARQSSRCRFIHSSMKSSSSSNELLPRWCPGVPPPGIIFIPCICISTSRCDRIMALYSSCTDASVPLSPCWVA
jgi:hypothetical protein